jgi:PLP dependent protein
VSDDDGRRSELVTSLGAVRSRIAEVCASCGRSAREVTLVAVTKTYPAADVVTLARLGVRDVGESRDQEATAKVAEVAALLAEPGDQPTPPQWHFLGRIQSRKCRSIARYAHAVHSLDRAELATRLADAVAERSGPPIQVFVQLSLDGDPERGGVVLEAMPALADAVAARPELSLRGVMAVAPLGADPDSAFAEVQRASARLRQQHPGADSISAGMSADLDSALRHGATHVRIGTALLGRRAPVIG